MSFPFYKQYEAMDCGPTCLRMIAKHYGKQFNILKLREWSKINREGVSLLGISEAAEKVGLKTLGSKITFEQLDNDVLLPCILHWKQNHFVVLPPQNCNGSNPNCQIQIADPAVGLIKVDKATFIKNWVSSGDKGVVLLIEPTPEFYENKLEAETKLPWHKMFYYLKQQKKYFLQVFIGLLTSTILQLIFPFLTQSIIDVGINTQNLTFIYIIVLAQSMLFFSRTIIDFIRNRLLLFISTRINISLLTNFWFKIMKLPLSYFDTKLTGDIQQRIQDQHQIESFLTGSSISILFSVINLFTFSIVLLIYDPNIFFIFLVSSLLYFFWIKIFMKQRRSLNYRHFSIASKENSATMQLILGMQEIKLNTSEKYFRWKWEHIQAELFKLKFKSLTLSQYQQAGAKFINEGRNILITFWVAKLVLDGQLTLGAMLAIQYIIGQLSSPVDQLVGFSQNLQDAKIALERLNEIEQIEDEEPVEKMFITSSLKNKSIALNNLSFKYTGTDDTLVLKDINLEIEAHKTTAIVGMSGSGKTTLLKLLLKFYDKYSGSILVCDKQNVNISPEDDLLNGLALTNRLATDLKNISASYWRNRCGCVMQDSFIFNDTILGNIAVGEEMPDVEHVITACKTANILSFVESLPLGLNTKIGSEGNGISQGQRQRILIARAVYKKPEFIFFDEATNSLDANNEKIIMQNLTDFFKGRTAVIVAHRLSTVKNADKIIVLHNGMVVEEGTHEELTSRKENYYNLVKNQLELGN